MAPDSANDPEAFREKWHEYIEQIESLKTTLHPDQWDDLDDALDEVHDLIDDAADELGDDE